MKLTCYKLESKITSSSARSLICRTSAKSIVHIKGSWANIVPSMKSIWLAVLEITCLQVFNKNHIKPRPLINMQDILNKINSAHLGPMGWRSARLFEQFGSVWKAGHYCFISSFIFGLDYLKFWKGTKSKAQWSWLL